MNAAKYFSPKYWARKFFALRPPAGATVPAEHWGEFIEGEIRGLMVARECRYVAVAAETRRDLILRNLRGPRVPGLDIRTGETIHAETRGVTA